MLAFCTASVQHARPTFPDFRQFPAPGRKRGSLALCTTILDRKLLTLNSEPEWPLSLSADAQKTLKESNMDAFDWGADAAAQGDLDLAIACFSEAVRLNPTDTQAYYNRAVCYWRTRKLDQALADLDKAIGLMPNHARSHGIRGAIHLEKAEDKQAIAELTEALRHDPKLVEAYGWRGGAYAIQGQHALAIADLSEAIRLDPGKPAGYVGRARVYRAIGNERQARLDEEMARELRRSAKP